MWKPPSNDPQADICFALFTEARRQVKQQLPDLYDFFPLSKDTFSAHVTFFPDQWYALTIEFDAGGQVPSIDQHSAEEMTVLLQMGPRAIQWTGEQISKFLGERFFSFEKFTHVGRYEGGSIDWQHLMASFGAWFNSVVFPRVEELNRARILRAIPNPPALNVHTISAAVWILECEESSKQGTAFVLKDLGLITCAHVLGPKTHAFRAANPSIKYPVSVNRQNPVLDLAVLSLPTALNEGLARKTADSLKQLDHVALYGFPNYRLGDTGVVVPGLVVGFRTVSGVRRVLTNAAIVAGSSGSPVLDGSGGVVGVAVTGSDSFDSAHTTEDHGIIPIDALKLL